MVLEWSDLPLEIVIHILSYWSYLFEPISLHSTLSFESQFIRQYFGKSKTQQSIYFLYPSCLDSISRFWKQFSIQEMYHLLLLSKPIRISSNQFTMLDKLYNEKSELFVNHFHFWQRIQTIEISLCNVELIKTMLQLSSNCKTIQLIGSKKFEKIGPHLLPKAEKKICMENVVLQSITNPSYSNMIEVISRICNINHLTLYFNFSYLPLNLVPKEIQSLELQTPRMAVNCSELKHLTLLTTLMISCGSIRNVASLNELPMLKQVFVPSQLQNCFKIQLDATIQVSTLK